MIVKAYSPNKKNFTADFIWGALLLLSVLFFYFSIKVVFSEKWNVLLNGLALVLFAVIGFRFAIRFGLKTPTNRVYLGDLHFQNHGIRINDFHFPIEEIERISFTIHENESDYFIPAHQFELYSSASGAENEVAIKLKDGTIKKFNFLLKKDESMMSMKTILEFWYSKKKISFLNLCDTIGVKNYDAIQMYKAALHPQK